MLVIISDYLENVKASLKLDNTRSREVISELAGHIEDKLEELKNDGLSEDEAARACLHLLGSARTIAHQIYEAHSQGSWRQALLASMPHFLFFLLFALGWWQGIGYLLILVALTATVVIYGWWHGKPTWLFPWMGYFLLPIIAAGLSLLYIPSGWSWLALVVYIPLALWLLSRVLRRARKQDWLYTSLMLLPLPLVVSWYIAVSYERIFSPYSIIRLQIFSPWIALSFLAIAIAVGTCVRLRKRWLKIASLSVTGTVTITLVAIYTWSRLQLPLFITLIVSMVGIFLVPALLESKPATPGEHYPPSLILLGRSGNAESKRNHR